MKLTEYRKEDKGKKKVNLALQGGGAFAAYTWGMLDKILEDGRLIFDGISSTSSGSVNAVITMQGLIRDGRDGARQLLHDFWYEISLQGNMLGFNLYTPIDYFLSDYLPAPFSLIIFQSIMKMLSPYQFNPYDINPLGNVLEKLVDFEELKKKSLIHLFVCATNVKTGKIRIFDNDHLSMNSVLASACLPYIFKAVEIDNQYYWDGGYTGNPAIYPLIYETTAKDIIIFPVTTIERSTLPINVEEIIARSKEISFNSSLMREMRAIAFVTKIIDEGYIKEEHRDRFKRVYIHSLESDDLLSDYSMINMLNTDWEFLTKLRDLGRSVAERWINKNYHSIGSQSTINLEQYLFGSSAYL